MTISIEWAEKYRPHELAELVGNKKAIEELRTWANEWLHGMPEKRAVILYGQAGVGKTSAAHALAQEFGWEAIELNASDQRTAGVIERIAGSASTMGSLDGMASKRLIILDEADNLHGSADRGGARAIGNIIKNTNQPIVLIANDVYGLSSTIRSLCLEIKFNTVQARSMIPALKKICKEEGIMVGVGVIEKIAEDAGGDMRSAINDLQAVSMGRDEINIEDIATSERDTKENIFKFLPKIFKGNDPKEALRATYGLDESPEDLVHWIDENLPIQYHPIKGEDLNEDIENGYEHLSRADIFLGRVKIRQNYRMWRYASVLMTCGVTVSKSHVRRGFIKYQAPSLWRKMGQLRAKRNMRDNIASKIGAHCKESMRYARSDLFSIYGDLLEDEDYAVDIVADLGLDIDEILYLTKSKKVTKKIQNIYDSAQSILKERAKEDIEFFATPKKERESQKGKQIDLNEITAKGQDTSPSKQNNGTETKKEARKPNSHKPQKTLFDF